MSGDFKIGDRYFSEAHVKYFTLTEQCKSGSDPAFRCTWEGDVITSGIITERVLNQGYFNWHNNYWYLHKCNEDKELLALRLKFSNRKRYDES